MGLLVDGGVFLGVAAALLALWVTFVPCFWVSNQPRLKGSLRAITAAVVGVILNLSIWFALHVLFSNVYSERPGPLTLWRPELASVEWLAVDLFFLNCLLAFCLHWGIIQILLVVSVLGVALRVI